MIEYKLHICQSFDVQPDCMQASEPKKKNTN